MAVLGGARDTGLRALAAIVAKGQLAPSLATSARGDGEFEALFEITGQQGADLSEKLLVARPRLADTP